MQLQSKFVSSHLQKGHDFSFQWSRSVDHYREMRVSAIVEDCIMVWSVSHSVNDIVSQPLADTTAWLRHLLTMKCMQTGLPGPDKALSSHQCCSLCNAATRSEPQDE